jgi:cytochrome c-type biogenesis protein CcmH
MTVFWLAAALMVMVVLALILPPLLGRAPRQRLTRKQLNVALYQERLAELEETHQAGHLDRETYQHTRAEIERAMLDDLAASQDESQPGRMANPIMAVFIAMGIPILAFGLYLQLGVPSSLEQGPPHPDMAATGDEGQQAASLESMVARLEARLETDPDNAEGWWMLARTYTALDRPRQALRAYAEAHQRLRDEPELLVGYAEVLASVNGNRFTGRPAALVQKALELAPDSERALLLSGIAAFQRGDKAQAIARWERLRNLGTLNAEEAGFLDEFIARAKGQGPSPPTPDQTATSSSGVAVADKGLRVQVKLAEDLSPRTSPSDPVFIFARASEGPRIPLAIVKTTVRDLPTTVVLDDSTAMNPQLKLSNYPEVIVGARVSKSGNAMRSPGDLEGLSDKIRPGATQTVQVSIEREVP